MRWVAFSSIFAGLAGYVVILLAAQVLGPARTEVFNVYWGLFFTLQGIIQGLMHETTRGVRAVVGADGAELAPEGAAGVSKRAQPLKAGLLFGIAAAVLVLVSSPFWASSVLAPGHELLGIALLVPSVFVMGLQAAFAGLLSGTAHWRTFGIFLTVEAALRVLVAGLAMLAGDPVTGFMIATVVGLLATPAFMFATTAGRSVLRQVTDVDFRGLTRRTLHAMAAASAAAVLVVGFPVLIKVTLTDVDPTVIGVLILAVTLTRAPILVPLTSFQNAIVVYFVDRVDKGVRALLVPLGIVMIVATVGAGLAYIAGPPIFSLLGQGFGISGEVLAALTFAAGFTGCLYISGSAALAAERHGSYLAGWWTATGVSILVLLLGPGAVVSTVLAMTIGPAVGLVVHVLSWVSSSRRRALQPIG